MNDNIENELMRELERKEKSSPLQYDGYDEDVSNYRIPDWIKDEDKIRENRSEPLKNVPPQRIDDVIGNIPRSLGKASFVSDPDVLIDGFWKNIPLANLSSEGFGYPIGTEISIRPADVEEIKYYSVIDENDRLDMDDKLNHILSKCCRIKWRGGPLSHYDIHYEDRFYLIMAIRDYTFPKGENRIFLPAQKNCTGNDCNIPDSIELRSSVLDSFKLSSEIKSKFNTESMCFHLSPKNGGVGLELFIPSVGVTTIIRKIISSKKSRNKKYDESFAEVAPYIIPNWRDLDEQVYDMHERASKEWDIMQLSIADQVSKLIKFSTKSEIRFNCEKCGGEVTAPLTFRGGFRSFFIISDILGQLL